MRGKISYRVTKGSIGIVREGKAAGVIWKDLPEKVRLSRALKSKRRWDRGKEWAWDKG